MVKQSMTAWLKVFSGILCGVYLLFLWLSSRCTFQIPGFDSQVILGTVTCFGYSVLAVGTFVFTLLPTLLGLQDAKTEGKSGWYFNTILGILFLSLAWVVILIVRR